MSLGEEMHLISAKLNETLPFLTLYCQSCQIVSDCWTDTLKQGVEVPVGTGSLRGRCSESERDTIIPNNCQWNYAYIWTQSFEGGISVDVLNSLGFHEPDGP
jgi:hypothetical protein